MITRLLALVRFILSPPAPIISTAKQPTVTKALLPDSAAADFPADRAEVNSALQSSPTMFIENVG